MAGKRRFGRVRRLPSGRFQARYPGPDGIDRPAPYTFVTKRDAEQWLVLKEAEIKSGDWLSPDAGDVSFKEYAEAWIKERPGLRPKTVERYEGLVRLHLIRLSATRPSQRSRMLMCGAGVTGCSNRGPEPSR